MSFLYTYNLSQIASKEDLFKGRIAGFEGHAYFSYFISYLFTCHISGMMAT